MNLTERPTKNLIAVISLLLLLPGSICTQTKPPPTRESILDTVVRTESRLITEIPGTFRWCDSLRLKTSRVAAAGCSLYVEEEGKGIPLVLVNGGPGGTHHYFHPWFSRAGEYARVIYYDQRGCGLSDFTPGPYGYSVEQAADDLEAVRKGLGIGKWVVLGYSYGGFLAQYYALRYPENLAGIILLGASPGMRVEMKGSREDDFLSDAERKRMTGVRGEIAAAAKEEKWPEEKKLSLLIYNQNLNGDWKRQHFYRPPPERIAQMALYEWVHDGGFNSVMNTSEGRVDLTGAFRRCPIPTLILEGKWDLTWNTDKPGILQENHPGSRLVVFQNGGHGIYDEETDSFFGILKEFMTSLPDVPPDGLARFQKDVISMKYPEAWNKELPSDAESLIESSGWGRLSNERLLKAYTRAWVNQVKDPLHLLKVGFALYDGEKYAGALMVFERMQVRAELGADNDRKAAALIWQGHMLDLLGRRSEAIGRYRLVVEMGNPGGMGHDQYGLRYAFTPYAKERMASPFVRLENAGEEP